MKKVNHVKNVKFVLSKKELNELKGGVDATLAGTSGKRNVNNTAYCTCSYNDLGAIKNINKVSGCCCDCKGPASE